MELIKSGKKSKYIPGGIINHCNCDLCISAKVDLVELKPLSNLKLILRTDEEVKKSSVSAYTYLIP